MTATNSPGVSRTTPGVSALAHPLTNVDCCVCGSSRNSVTARGGDFEYATTSEEFTVRTCSDCGHVFLSPRPHVADLGVIYPPNYYSYSFIAKLSPLARRIKMLMDSRKVEGWLSECSTKSPQFLEVGCGEGWFMQLLHARGIDKTKLWGVELDEGVIQRLNAAGYQARCGAIENIHDLPERSFDLIVSLQVIEHLAEPGAVLKRMTSLLAPGGTLILETPNVDSLDYRAFHANYWGGYHFPRHWNLFTPESMARLIAPLGLRIARTRYLPAPTFWLYSLHHLLKYGKGWQTAARFTDPLRNLPFVAAAVAFDRVRAGLGARTSNMQLIIRHA